MLVLLLMQAKEPGALIARVRALTAIERPCPADRGTADITVCGRRTADRRFRLPLQTVRQPGASLLDNAAAERTALLHRTTPIQDLGPFLVGGGFAGVSVGTSFGPGADSGKVSVAGARPFAP